MVAQARRGLYLPARKIRRKRSFRVSHCAIQVRTWFPQIHYVRECASLLLAFPILLTLMELFGFCLLLASVLADPSWVVSTCEMTVESQCCKRAKMHHGSLRSLQSSSCSWLFPPSPSLPPPSPCYSARPSPYTSPSLSAPSLSFPRSLARAFSLSLSKFMNNEGTHTSIYVYMLHVYIYIYI